MTPPPPPRTINGKRTKNFTLSVLGAAMLLMGQGAYAACSADVAGTPLRQDGDNCVYNAQAGNAEAFYRSPQSINHTQAVFVTNNGVAVISHGTQVRMEGHQSAAPGGRPDQYATLHVNNGAEVGISAPDIKINTSQRINSRDIVVGNGGNLTMTGNVNITAQHSTGSVFDLGFLDPGADTRMTINGNVTASSTAAGVAGAGIGADFIRLGNGSYHFKGDVEYTAGSGHSTAAIVANQAAAAGGELKFDGTVKLVTGSRGDGAGRSSIWLADTTKDHQITFAKKLTVDNAGPDVYALDLGSGTVTLHDGADISIADGNAIRLSGAAGSLGGNPVLNNNGLIDIKASQTGEAIHSTVEAGKTATFNNRANGRVDTGDEVNIRHSGAGVLKIDNAGTLAAAGNYVLLNENNGEISMDNSGILTGSVNDAGAGSTTLRNTGTWTNTVHDSNLDTLENSGSVIFGQNYGTDRIIKVVDYTGNNGQLLVNSVWNDGATPDGDSASNLLDITGTATGRTTVRTHSGIIGNITLKDQDIFTVPVVRVADGGHADAFFGSAETTNAGQAQLIRKDDNTYVWTLKARSGTDILTPSAPGYVQMPGLNLEQGYATLATLHERRGENQAQAHSAAANQGQSWGRVLGKHLKQEGSERFNSKSRISGVQVGHDFAVEPNERGGRRFTGLYAAYTHGSHDFADRYRAENGVVVDDTHSGSGSSRAVSLGVSNTYYTAQGSYVDLVGQLSYLKNRYNPREGAGLKQSGRSVALSAEAAHPFALSRHASGSPAWQLEPQVQLVYQHLNLKGSHDGVRQIEQGKRNDWRGRIGARVAYQRDAAESGAQTFYGVLNLWRDLAGKRSVWLGQDELKERQSRSWVEIGGGVQLPVGKQSHVYGDARYEHDLSSRSERRGIRGTVGFKYSW
ncbi:outer membrane autotransporter protein [Neisseria sp. HSC-16F19]|nr:autotransporter outer membrane beta-barrel domain-containing protein [Neisseria sp. HSC-16F19]MCP2039885.1 outer membrane autotransporter protein [Neisseria sp. HSC-16F19]